MNTLHTDLKNAIKLHQLKNPDFTSLENICRIDFIEDNIKPVFIADNPNITKERLEHLCYLAWINLIKNKVIDNFSREI